MTTTPPAPAGLGRIGSWRVLRRLGRGGVASVYEVVDPDTGRRVALKLYRDPALTGSLEREYRALAGLDHPSIVRVLGRGKHGGSDYLLMELVLGRAAQACARHAGVPGSDDRTAVTLRVVHDLLEALAYLHRRGIVHRDIKSSNVLADTSGQVKLLDLGTAGYGRRRDGGEPSVPGLQHFAGTVVYASPEQLGGLPLDGRSDLYSVGVLWYRMLTGDLPFAAGSREQALELRRTVPPEPAHRRVEGIPESVGALVDELLALEPDGRPASAQRILQRLRPLMVRGGARAGSPWPEPPPLFGRSELLEELDDFVTGEAPDSLCLLQGAPGLGVPELMRWIGQQARRSGCWVLQVSAVGGGPGNLISRLLLAVPRHVRRGLRGLGNSSARSAHRVARAVELLARLDRALGRRVLLLLSELERSESCELAELVELMQLVQRRGLSVRAIAGWEREDPGLPEPFERTWPDLRCVRLEALDARATQGHLRSLVGGRALPPAILASLLREASGRPAVASSALASLVDVGRLRPGRTPEGTPCWLETLAGVDEPADPVGESLARVLGQPVDGPPWAEATSPAPRAHGIPLSDLIASTPEEHPEPWVRAVLHAWRGHARIRCGDRDLQADADLLQADEELRSAEQSGWLGAPGWREYVALVRAVHLAGRGRQLEAQRRLQDASTDLDGPWQMQQRQVAALLLAAAEGEPMPEPGGGQAGLELTAARASSLLQAGRVQALLESDLAQFEATEGWDAEPFARLTSARAGALRLRGELSRAVQLLERALTSLERFDLGPPRAQLLASLAEVELELYRPGLSREHLADCFVLLRHCDRPELSAGRERIRGRVALACGEPDRAEGAFRTALNMLRGTGFHVAAAELQCQLARALARQGRRREAIGLLGSARERLAAAGALPALAVACAAGWEAGRPVAEILEDSVLVEAWLDREQALLVACDLSIARLRHAVNQRQRDRVDALESEYSPLLGGLLSLQSPEDRAILELHPWMRMRRRR